MNSKDAEMLAWVVAHGIDKAGNPTDADLMKTGLSRFNFTHTCKGFGDSGNRTIISLECLTKPWPGSWEEQQLVRVGRQVCEGSERRRKNSCDSGRARVMVEVSPSEFWTFWG